MASEFDIIDNSQYEISSVREINKILRGVQSQNLLVTLSFQGGVKLILTSILEIDEAENLVIIDPAQQASLNQMLLESSRIVFNCVHEKIRILFTVTGIARTEYEGKEALCFDLPQTITPLQRREDFRVVTSLTAPIQCRIQYPTQTSAGKESIGTTVATLINISAGGLAFIDDKRTLPVNAGALLDHCQIIIPDQPPIDLALEIRNVTELNIAGGKKVLKFGCKVTAIGKAEQNSVLRLISKLERAEINRLTGKS